MRTPQEEFAAFLAWKENQGASTPENEHPPVTIAEVLHALINSAQFHTEATAREYHDAVTAYFAEKDVKDVSVKASDG